MSNFEKINSLKTGYVQVYTGNGKGKTTAAIGLAIRAAGAGLKVYFAQFIKGMVYSEIDALGKFQENITVRQFGRGCFINRNSEQKDIDAAKTGLETIRQAMLDDDYDIVIMDEVNVAVEYKLVSVEELLEVIEAKPLNTELVMTGRYAHDDILQAADLVTEMKEVKHYYQKGIQARTGIER